MGNVTVQRKERPIIFNAAMVRAILDGKKTQTRRVMKPQPQPNPHDLGRHWVSNNTVRAMVEVENFLQGPDTSVPGCFCPLGQPGDRLWVREQVRICDADGDGAPLTTPPVWYMADGPCPDLAAWSHPRPSIHMPKWASRILLEITEVRVQRLRDISEDDARAEGCHGGHGSIPEYPHSATPNEHFWQLWDSLAAPGARWEDNPWVWAVSFKRVEA